jgi:hypothetical protein
MTMTLLGGVASLQDTAYRVVLIDYPKRAERGVLFSRALQAS